MFGRRACVTLAGLLAVAAVAATGPELVPAEQCLAQTEGAKPLQYPSLLLERKDGGTVEVELSFTRADRAPGLRVLNEKQTFTGLVSAVEAHVRTLRLPCLPAGAPPVVLRQNYVFTPNDGRKVVASAPRDVAEAARQRQITCLRHENGETRPEYPRAALRHDHQGPVLVRLHFTAVDAPPRVEMLAVAHPALRSAVQTYVAGLRLPCLEDASLTLSQVYQFRLDGGTRTVLRDVTLLGLVQGAKEAPLGVYFDLNTMSCPFDLRLTYYRPHQRNLVQEVETSVPARQPFLDWLSQVTLNLPLPANTAVLGETMTVRVPCTTVDL